MNARTFSLSLVTTAFLAACGGGGDGEANFSFTNEDAAAVVAAANGTLLASDTTTALDSGVLAAQVVVSAQAAAGRADDVIPDAVADVLVNCAGGGTATLSISRGTAGTVSDGQFDTGEVYGLVFANCKGSVGSASVNGNLSITVQDSSAGNVQLALTATQLALGLPRGTVTINGSSLRQITSNTSAGNTTTVNSRYTATSLSLATQFNNRNRSFTLSGVDITRQAVWVAGVLQGTTMNGNHTLSATLPSGSFTHTVSTQGNVSYSANGLPSAGSWLVTLPNSYIAVVVAGSTALVTVDEGRNGSIDRTFTISLTRLQDDAG